ncbi:MAG: DUF2203 domain-containing protein [Phycisphaerae bacterium]
MRSVKDTLPLETHPRTESPQRFTLQEANRTLPLVTRIVRDLQGVYLQARDRHRQLVNAMGTAARWDAEAKLEQTLARLEALEEELRQIGCRVDDYEAGRVVFPGVHEQQPVLLNWSVGEPSIYYFHAPQAGYPGRRPVSVLAEG